MDWLLSKIIGLDGKNLPFIFWTISLLGVAFSVGIVVVGVACAIKYLKS